MYKIEDMKKLYTILSLLPLLGMLPAYKGNKSPDKLAFIVAIGDYPDSVDWSDLSSKNDIPLIKDALIKQGFTEKGMTVLLNQDATYNGIINGLAEFKKKITKDAKVVIHFSSHGQQIEDDNNDELDGLDEAIVPYDARSNNKNGYRGQRHLRDDQLGKEIKEIRELAGPNGDILVLFDACHSGTMTRGPKTRGNKGALRFKKSDKQNLGMVPKLSEHSETDGIIEEKENAAPIAVISAARSWQPNTEYEHCGSLSWAFNQAMNSMQPGETYQSLFGRITASMSKIVPGQDPALEGKANRLVFTGEVVKQAPYFNLNNILSEKIEISGGTLVGLYKGTKVMVLPAGTLKADSSKAVAYGEVVIADRQRAFIQISNKKDLTSYKKAQLWVMVTEQTFGGQKLKIKLNENLNKNEREIVKEKVGKLNFIEFNEEFPDLVIGTSKGKYWVCRFDSTALQTNLENVESINIFLSSYMQGKLIRETNFTEPGMLVEVDLLPIKIGVDDLGYHYFDRYLNKEDFIQNGALEFKPGDVVQFVFRNKGNKDAYINLLEITPSGKVELVYPNPRNNESSAEFKILKGSTDTIKTDVREFSKPFGKFTFKVFATSVPVDMKQIALTRGEGNTRGYQHPLQQMLKESYLIPAQRNQNISLGTSGAGTTFELSFNIKE